VSFPRIFTSLLMVLASIISFAQNAQYDVRLELERCNCCTNQIFANINVRASSADATFRIADQRYAFSFNRFAVQNVELISEGTISGFIATTDGDLGFSVYNPHNLTMVSGIGTYNVLFAGGDGLLIETEWVNVGTFAFNIWDIDAPLDLNWFMQNDFPSTFVSEVTETGANVIAEGMYINDIPLSTFGDCPCSLASAISLTNQEEINNFAIDYPDAQVADLVIESSDGLIDDLTPLSTINSIERLIITNNNALNSLAGLENINNIECGLEITNNPQLDICNIPAICNYLESGGTVTISNNAVGCNNNIEVLQSCFLPVEMSTPLQVRLQNQTAVLTWRTETYKKVKTVWSGSASAGKSDKAIPTRHRHIHTQIKTPFQIPPTTDSNRSILTAISLIPI